MSHWRHALDLQLKDGHMEYVRCAVCGMTFLLLGEAERHFEREHRGEEAKVP